MLPKTEEASETMSRLNEKLAIAPSSSAFGQECLKMGPHVLQDELAKRESDPKCTIALPLSPVVTTLESCRLRSCPLTARSRICSCSGFAG